MRVRVPTPNARDINDDRGRRFRPGTHGAGGGCGNVVVDVVGGGGGCGNVVVDAVGGGGGCGNVVVVVSIDGGSGGRVDVVVDVGDDTNVGVVGGGASVDVVVVARGPVGPTGQNVVVVLPPGTGLGDGASDWSPGSVEPSVTTVGAAPSTSDADCAESSEDSGAVESLGRGLAADSPSVTTVESSALPVSLPRVTASETEIATTTNAIAPNAILGETRENFCSPGSRASLSD